MSIGMIEESNFALKVQHYMREFWDLAGERLYETIQDDDLDATETLLAQGVDPNILSEEGTPPLIQAVCRERIEMVNLLLRYGADANIRGAKKETALMEAAKRGLEPIVRRLLMADADPNLQTATGRTALWEAVAERRLPIVEALMAKGANPNGDGGAFRDTPLMKAASLGDLEMVRFLLKVGANPNIRAASTGKTALCVAAYACHEKIVLYLISHGADGDQMDGEGRTPLIAALAAGDCHLAHALVRFTNNLEARDKTHGWTAVLWSAARGDLSILRRLLDKGACLDVQGVHGETPLALAEENFRTALAKWLKRRGAAGKAR